ncbi:DUF805 domain-containing protein [Sphingomonas sp. R647]|uniref:DUF805 domain-containing protein n=1 Tax=Sphingomonas sp. R647 TaxID=2875233 RepID=UPI001CD44F08|nr:DUF805 domain-containing protein [Sphingomonas sp. R647]MCA1199311.1 DUF805 domain-containing protein [Sphingomonas sp. R647]
MDKILRPWRHYVDFSGRSTRTEFWLFIIIFYAVLMVLAFAGGVFSAAAELDDPADTSISLTIIPMALWILACLLPSIAVTVRRLHDSDKSGWLFLLTIIPYLGFIMTLIFGFWPGTHGENSYGFDPRLGEGTPDYDAPEIFS